LEDTPCYNYFPGRRHTVEYRESIYAGYRYYEKTEKPVLFPFGHGLSYVDFIYSDLKLDREAYNIGDTINITFNIKNRGRMAARETALIFVGHKNDKVFLPEKELRDFIKIYLEPGETKKVTVSLDTSAFGYYNTLIKDWYAESGEYQIMVGSSSKDCALNTGIYLNSPEKPQPDLTKEVPTYYQLPKKAFEIEEKEFEALYGHKLPAGDCRASRPYNWDNTLDDVSHTFIGKIIIWYAGRLARKVTETEEEQEGMMAAMIREMPFFAIASSGEISESMMEGIIDLLNGHYMKGVPKLFK
jgi:beta-glucosidase